MSDHTTPVYCYVSTSTRDAMFRDCYLPRHEVGVVGNVVMSETMHAIFVVSARCRSGLSATAWQVCHASHSLSVVLCHMANFHLH